MTDAQAPFDFEQARFNMIEQQIRPWEVLDAAILGLLAQVKREDFVPAAFRSVALADLEIPLAPGASQGRCMLAPKVEARLLQNLALQATDTVLHIGTGSGYLAALMGKMCARVTSIEIDPTLARQARANLQQAGVANVDVKEADAAAHGFAACHAGAPYNAIVLDGSVADIPPALLSLLGIGGRLWAVVGNEPVMRATLVRRTGEASFHTEQPWDTVAPRLVNFPQPSRFRF